MIKNRHLFCRDESEGGMGPREADVEIRALLLARLRALPVRVMRHAALFGRRAGAHPLNPCDELLDVGSRRLGELDGLVRVRVRVRVCGVGGGVG
jgi:hypothetical protein